MEHAVIIDIRTPDEICRNLNSLGLHLLKIPQTDRVSTPVSAHPDIQLFIHGKTVFVHPDIDRNFAHYLEQYCEIIYCKTRLGSDYPADIVYNIAYTGIFAIHNLRHTDPALLDYLESVNAVKIDVKQGYSKCSTLIVNERSVITADVSIHSAARAAGLDSLLISPGNIDLPGYKYGFIGGAAARFAEMVLFTGSIDGHPDRNKIHEFIESRGLNVRILSKQQVLDIGSLLFVNRV